MKSLKEGNRLFSFKKTVIPVIIIILVLLPLYAAASDSTTKISKEQRDDGLTIVLREPDQAQAKQELQFVNLIIKAGYAHDPIGKFGITNLTNELIFNLLRHTSVIDIDYQTYADYSIFQFVTTRNYFNDFCTQLDQIIRSDALLLYDLCNDLVHYHLNQPKSPELAAISQFYSMVYGSEHPYNSFFTPNYDKLNITEINKWFRHIYKPNNFIISSSLKLPDDFLRKPSGRDLKETVTLSEVPIIAADYSPELKYTLIHDNIATVCLGFETPRMDGEGVFATFLIEKYLNQRLWKIIREENGLSYDPEVFSLLISKSSAPTLQAVLHTLAPDTGKVINMIIAEFKKVAAEGIPEAEIAQIIGQERKKRELYNKDLKSAVAAAALYGLLNQKWLVNQEDYFSRLNEEAKIISQVMTEGLVKLKISVAGPKGTDGYLNGVAKELELLTQE